MRFQHISLGLAVVAMLAISGCQSTQHTSASGSSDGVAVGAVGDRPVATMWVHGMGCPQCSYNVDLQLKKVAGVEDVKVDMSSGRVQAFLSPSDPPTREQLTKAIGQTTFTLVRLDMPGESVK
jgi:copper chaperone CopZ